MEKVRYLNVLLTTVPMVVSKDINRDKWATTSTLNVRTIHDNLKTVENVVDSFRVFEPHTKIISWIHMDLDSEEVYDLVFES